MLNEVHAMKT